MRVRVLLCACLALAFSGAIGAIVLVVARRHAALRGEEVAPAVSTGADFEKPSATPSPSRRAARAGARTTPTPSVSRRPRPECMLTHTDGRRVTDSHGRVCAPQQVVAATNCCPTQAVRYDCAGCEAQCCDEYERCVSCCMQRPGRSFQRCASECRSSSASLDEHGRYAAERHHCFGGARPPVPSASPSPSGAPVRWLNLAPPAGRRT